MICRPSLSQNSAMTKKDRRTIRAWLLHDVRNAPVPMPMHMPSKDERNRERSALRLDHQAAAVAAGGDVERLVERFDELDIVHPAPAIAAEALEGPEARLVGHSR